MLRPKCFALNNYLDERTLCSANSIAVERLQYFFRQPPSRSSKLPIYGHSPFPLFTRGLLWSLLHVTRLDSDINPGHLTDHRRLSLYLCSEALNHFYAFQRHHCILALNLPILLTHACYTRTDFWFQFCRCLTDKALLGIHRFTLRPFVPHVGPGEGVSVFKPGVLMPTRLDAQC